MASPSIPFYGCGPVTWDLAHWRTAAASRISGDTGKFCLTKGTAHSCSGVLALLRELARCLQNWSEGLGWYTCVCVCVCVYEVAQSCPTLCDPVDCSPPDSSVHGILQARVLEWVAISFSRGSSQPRDWTQVSCITGRCFILWATKEAKGDTHGEHLILQPHLFCVPTLYLSIYSRDNHHPLT